MAKFITVHVVVDRSEGLRRTGKRMVNPDFIAVYYDNDADHRHASGAFIVLMDGSLLETTEDAEVLSERIDIADREE